MRHVFELTLLDISDSRMGASTPVKWRRLYGSLARAKLAAADHRGVRNLRFFRNGDDAWVGDDIGVEMYEIKRLDVL